ncbi:protein CC2D2B isoform X10 [Odocoileus virginianus]|uniref:Protein CC2D2B isoform X10 n=1 Tax=Odocoileus virginianus TaxID=9874 RepID=A0ABM4IDZ9_ODOVR
MFSQRRFNSSELPTRTEESELKVFCSKNILSILGFSCIIAVIALLALGLTQNKALPENLKFGIVLDAGSSHTNLYIYRWPAEKENDTGVVTQIEECKLKGPGISGFAKKLQEINVYLTACMERARKVIPSAQHPETPVYLGATAGMRLLRMENQQMADKILNVVAKSINKYPFDFQGARIISGQEEGAYGWITVNYLLGKFTQKLSWFNLKPSKDDTQETYGALDLGGASTQITFVPQNEMIESPNNNLYFRLYGKNYSVYTHSFLCYGKDQALLQKLALELQGTSEIIHEPCFHSGYLRKLNMSVFNEGFCARRYMSTSSYHPFFDIEVRGTGNFQQCQQGIIQLFNSSYCPYSRCSFNGVFLPPLQGQFGAFSAFYYVMEFLNLTSQEHISTKKLTEKLEEFCTQSWEEVRLSFGDVKEAYLSEYCFSGTYILALLQNGYHFTDESWKTLHFMNKMSEDTDNTAGKENVEKHLQKDLNVEENRSIIETLRSKVREKLKNAKINQGEKASTQLLIDNKIYQWSKAEVPLDEGLSFFVLSGEEDSAKGQSAEQNFSEGQDEDFVEEVIFPDLLEVKAADYEDDQEQIKKQQANIFIPSSSPVINQLKLPEDMMPRILEEEGFYIQKKPEIYKKTCNKMENRLLKLEEGKCWFEESGEIMSLPSPIRRSWNFRLNISKEPLNPALKTMYRKAVKSDVESSVRNKMEGQREMYQLDLNIVGLQFSHHPLFNQEQVLCARLLQLYECFQDRQQQNLPQLLYEKLKALTDATKLANENSEISQLTRKSLQDYYWQISNTKQLYELEKEKDFSLLHSILRTWKQIKSLRQRQGFTSTSVKLQFQRLKMNKCDEQKQELSKMWGTEKKTEGKAFKNRKKQEYIKHKGQDIPNYFRLEQLQDEFNFVSEEEMKKSKRFQLLQLRNAGQLDVFLLQQMPLYDREIPDLVFQEYESQIEKDMSISDVNSITAQRINSANFLQKMRRLVMRRIVKVSKFNLSDIVADYEEIVSASQLTYAVCKLLEQRRKLKPQRKERKKVAAQTVCDRDIKILIRILRAYNIPTRKTTVNRSLGMPTYLVSSMSRLRHKETIKSLASDEILNEETVHPFVEVSFQHTVYQTSIASGSHPCWNEEIKVDFILPGHDCNFSSLSKIKDNIYINIFDEMIIEKHEDRCFKSCSGHSYIRKNWLGSIVFPFSALLQQSEISGTFQVNIPPVLLGYTWSKTYVSPKEDYNGQNLKECTFLNIFATIEPQISYTICSPELDKFSDQIDVLERAWIFTKNCKALFPKRRIITTVFNDEGIQILVIRYIKALNPPQQLLDMFLHYSNATLDLVAHFVSLIPVMPDALDENDGFNIWMTSEHCISLAIGNKEEHAILLCNFFLYFGKKALVLLGTSVLEGHVAYVLTQETDEYLLWNPLTGQCHKQFDPFCPLQGVDCLFDGENVWFNLQQNNSPMAVYFDYSKESFWKQLLPKNYQGTNTQSIQPEEIIYSDTNKSMVEDLKNRIERTLKCKIMEWRPKQPTRWNRQCTLILRQILPKLELGTASFVSSEEESEFERLLQFYWVTGFPIQMPYTDVQSVIDAVYQTGIHSSEFPQTEFALAVYIHPYPNNILSVWVYLASLARHQ